MAADTFSSLLHLRLQATGNNFNDWINKFNNDVVKVLEQAICGASNMLPASISPIVSPLHFINGSTDGSSFSRILNVGPGGTETVWITVQSPFLPQYWVIANAHPTGPVVFSIGISSTIDQAISIPNGVTIVFYDGSNPQTSASLWTLA